MYSSRIIERQKKCVQNRGLTGQDMGFPDLELFKIKKLDSIGATQMHVQNSLYTIFWGNLVYCTRTCPQISTFTSVRVSFKSFHLDRYYSYKYESRTVEFRLSRSTTLPPLLPPFSPVVLTVMHENQAAVPLRRADLKIFRTVKHSWFFAMPTEAITIFECVPDQMTFSTCTRHEKKYDLNTSQREYLQVLAFTVNGPVIKNISIWNTSKNPDYWPLKTVPIA